MTNLGQQIINFIAKNGWIHDLRRHGWVHEPTNQFIPETMLESVRDSHEVIQKLLELGHIKSAGEVVEVDPKFHWDPKLRLKARLDMSPTKNFPWPLQIIEGPEVTSILITTNNGNKVLVLEDDTNLFPSDTLVGKLRLLTP